MAQDEIKAPDDPRLPSQVDAYMGLYIIFPPGTTITQATELAITYDLVGPWYTTGDCKFEYPAPDARDGRMHLATKPWCLPLPTVVESASYYPVSDEAAARLKTDPLVESMVNYNDKAFFLTILLVRAPVIWRAILREMGILNPGPMG